MYVKPNREIRVSDFRQPRVGAPLTTISDSAAKGADDECLSSPKDQTPQGGHLVLSYRSRHETSLLVSQGETTKSRLKPQQSRFHRIALPFQRSIAEARAELPAQGTYRQPNRGNRLTSADVAVSAMNSGYKTASCGDTANGCRLRAGWVRRKRIRRIVQPLLTSPQPPWPVRCRSSVSNGPMANSNSPMANKVDSDTNRGAAAPARTALAAPLAVPASSR